MHKSLQRAFIMILIATSLIACNVLPAAPTSAPPPTAPALGSPATMPATAAPTAAPPTSAPAALPRPGEWTARTDFGTLVFVVNPNGTGIPKWIYTFSTPTCLTPPAPQVTGETQSPDGYPIKDGQFVMDHQWIRIRGTFDKTGTTATGTWENPRVPSCSGTWQAAPAN